MDDEAAEPEMVGDGVIKPLNQRLVAWMVDLLLDDIKKAIHSQKLLSIRAKQGKNATYHSPEGATFMDEDQ